MLLAGRVPDNNLLLAGRVPDNNFILNFTLLILDDLVGITVSKIFITCLYFTIVIGFSSKLLGYNVCPAV